VDSHGAEAAEESENLYEDEGKSIEVYVEEEFEMFDTEPYPE
jgi:hypothetical protein